MSYIAFIDESGDHGLDTIDPLSPVFVLGCCLYKFDDYISKEIQLMSKCKIERWGHEGVIFRSYDIRKKVGPFSFCADHIEERKFHQELGEFFTKSSTCIIAAAIDKELHKKQYSTPEDPYFLSMQFVLERIDRATHGNVHIVFESRGKKEDAIVKEWATLERFPIRLNRKPALHSCFVAISRREAVSASLEIALICNGKNYSRKQFNFTYCFAEKKTNVTGLQVADLVSYPISHYVRNRNTKRPDWLAVKPCIRQSNNGTIIGYGLKIFPR